MIRTILRYAAVIVAGLSFFSIMVFYVVPSLQDSTIILPSVENKKTDSGTVGNEKDLLEKENNQLETRLDKYTPSKSYLVVNTSDNHFYLYKDKKMIRDGICSTGKNEKLIVDTKNKKKEYVFYTPLGVRTVQSKQPNPVWAKPDWAFIEDGLPIPPKGDPSRFESGTLGAYKLVLGDGYMIHGTIYKRFIGMNVTHGCIRLLDDDLEAVYKTLEVGSKIYIY